MGKIWLDYLCQIDHMWPDVQDMTGKEDTEMTETDSIGRKIGKVTPRKRKSNMNLTQERLHYTNKRLNSRFNVGKFFMFEMKTILSQQKKWLLQMMTCPKSITYLIQPCLSEKLRK